MRARKRLLQAHARTLLPAAVGQRPKRGFGVPVAEWLRGGLREQTQALAGDLAAWDRRGLLNPDLVAHLVGEHLAGRRNYAFPVWALLCLRLWYEEVDSL